ncbi:MAG: pyridoxamine 5'-phosphate oxidase family protein [Acidimicrobiales bacterium]|nr:pyridoxamine 5'-phosphate oxidase family protein [Acidimicrobiales bacterium]
MSIKVTVEELPDTLADMAPAAFLSTAGADGRPKVTHVPVRVVGSTLEAPVGAGTAANIGRQPLVCLVWPGSDDQSMSLLVDAVGSTEERGGEQVAVFHPSGAVWHRPAPAA